MRKAFRALVIVAAAAAVAGLAGCGGGGSSTRTARLMGRVTDTAGLPVEGATVSLTSSSAVATTTNASGDYVLTNVPTGGREFTVSFSKAGLAESLAVARVGDGRSAMLNVVMMKEGRTVAIDGTQESVVADNRADGLNCKVTFPANSILTASGQPVANPSVTVTTATPGDTNFSYAYPGLFMGVVSVSEVPLVSYGLVNVSLKDSSGQPAKLDPAKPAVVEIPASGATEPQVPIWSLDKTTGRWMPEFMAVRDDTVSPPVYRAQVTHFSWWALNLYPSTPHRIRVTVVADPAIKPVVPVSGAFVTVKRDGVAWQARGITSSSGVVEFLAPPSSDPYRLVEAKKANHEDRGVHSISTAGDTTDVVYWLRPLDTGSPGGP